MSLINQVLRDLDQRHASAGAAPIAARPARAAATDKLTRVKRWGAGLALTAAAVVVGGVAQGSIPWAARSAPAADTTSVAPPAAAVVMPAPGVAPATAVAMPAPVQTAPAAPSPQATPPLAARPSVTAPAPTPAPPVLLAKAAESSAPALPTLRPEPPIDKPASIDKRTSARTPQQRAQAHYQRGVASHQAGLIDDSYSAFIAALQEDPTDVPARQAAAGVLIQQSRREEAHALLQAGMALTPEQPTLALMLARLQAEQGELAAAAATLKTSWPQARGHAEYLGYYAAVLQRAGQHAEAIDHFNAALRLRPSHSVWWMGLAISLAAQGQNATAREAFQRAKALGSLTPDAGQYVELRLRQLG